MTVVEILALLASGAAAGAINAVAGGGTLVTFPTLLFFNTAPVVANATSTFALVIGTGGSIFGFRKHLPAVAPWLWRFTPVSILGGLLGSELLTRTNERLFSKLVPFLILFATVLFLLNGVFRVGAVERGEPGRGRVWGAMIFQFFVSIYGGYFGAGIGILMLATLGFLGLKNIHEMNTVKTTIGSLINVVATFSFVAHGLVDWPKACVMMVGAVGYFLGSHFSQRISPRQVRRIIAVIGLGISLVTFYQQFLKTK